MINKKIKPFHSPEAENSFYFEEQQPPKKIVSQKKEKS